MPSQNIDVILRVLNSRRFQSEMYAAGRSAGAMGKEFTAAGRAASGLATAGNIATGAMYGMAGAARTLGYGIGAVAGGVAILGVQFNATMEQNTLALEHFAGSVEASKDLTMRLFEIAKTTPFASEDITTAARRFMAFGFTVEETEGLLKTMGDTLSYTGGNTDEILRMAKAFGDIQAKGKLMQQELLQLTNLNLPIHEILEEQLNLTDKQFSNIGRANIKADEAIGAITAGLEARFGGGAQKYMETFNGQWQRLVDNIKMASGTATGSGTGLFAWLKDGLKATNEFAEKANKYLGSEKFQKLAATIGGVFKTAFLVVKGAVTDFFDALKPAQPFLENVIIPLLGGVLIGVIGGVVVAWEIFTGALKVVATVLGWVGERLAFLKPVFKIVGVAIGFIFGGPILKGIAAFFSGMRGILGVFGALAGLASGPISLVGAMLGKVSGVVTGLWRDAGFFFGRMQNGFGALVRWIGGAGASIRNHLVGPFKQAVEIVANLFERWLGIGPAIIRLGVRIGDWLFTGIKNTITKLFVGAAAFAASVGRGIADWLNAKTPFGDRVNLGFIKFTIPALAEGGYISSGGAALVGEQGPEILHLPTGASVVPLAPASPQRGSSATPPGGPAFDAVRLELYAPVMLDRRQVGQAMGEYVAERKARA